MSKVIKYWMPLAILAGYILYFIITCLIQIYQHSWSKEREQYFLNICYIAFEESESIELIEIKQQICNCALKRAIMFCDRPCSEDSQLFFNALQRLDISECTDMIL